VLKVKVKDHPVQKLEWKQTYRRTDAVGKYRQNGRQNDGLALAAADETSLTADVGVAELYHS